LGVKSRKSGALTVTGASGLLINQIEEIKLNPEQRAFMDKYENWLEDFTEMARFQKQEPDNLENNKKLMSLSEKAGLWQKELVEYMKDENFARYYMIVTERVTSVI